MYIAQCSCSDSPAFHPCSRTSRRSSPTTTPPSAASEHAGSTRLRKASPWQAHSERLCGTCTHAPTKLGSASRGHGRTACTQEHRLWPMGARPRPGRHAATELAADVAVPRTCVPALVERVARRLWPTWTGTPNTAARVERVPVASPQRRYGVRGRERYTRPRHQKVRTPYPSVD